MHFCSQCQNMYYIRISEEDPNKLIYYCRNCGNENNNLNELTSNQSFVVSKIQLKNNEQQFNNIINKYTKLDPTLPRLNTILCPNAECLTNTSDEPREIIYIRYDDINLKYIYLCSTCDTCWKNEDQK